jgi:carbon-monoxide dehydrogenase medium subunit
VKPASFNYIRARTVDEVLAALSEHSDARVLAGGQSLIAMMNLRLIKPEYLVDINHIADLDYIRLENDELAIGALTRHTTAASSNLVRENCPLMAAAYGYIAHKAVRNRGTVGGNICHADPASENPAVAIAAEATMVLRNSNGERKVPADDFFIGLYETAADQNELLTEIRFPKAKSGQGFSFKEVSARKGDFAIVCVAASIEIENGTCSEARIVASGVGEKATRLITSEEAVKNSPADGKNIEIAANEARAFIDPPSDFHADSEYRKDLVCTLTKRALEEASEHCRRGK